jgi:RNase P/RNase MRP subunit POP5
MVVKSKIGRKRYIVFQIDTGTSIDKRALIYTIKKNFQGSRFSFKDLEQNKPIEKESEHFQAVPWVIYIRNNYGLVRCHHLDTDKTIAFLQSIRQVVGVNQPVKIKTLGTTGTIKSARKKYLDKYFLYPLNNYTK